MHRTVNRIMVGTIAVVVLLLCVATVLVHKNISSKTKDVSSSLKRVRTANQDTINLRQAEDNVKKYAQLPGLLETTVPKEFQESEKESLLRIVRQAGADMMLEIKEVAGDDDACPKPARQSSIASLCEVEVALISNKQMDYAQLQNLLLRIQTNQRKILVDKVSVSATRPGSGQFDVTLSLKLFTQKEIQ